MTPIFRLLGTFAIVLGLATTLGHVADAQELKQIKLSDKQIEGYIAAQQEMNKITPPEAPAGKPDDKADAKIEAQFEAVAKKHGFASFAEMDDVAANISLVYSGIDPESGAFTDPISIIKKEITDIEGDAAIPAEDKKQMIAELNEAMKSTPPLKFPENVELVKKYRTRLDAVMQ